MLFRSNTQRIGLRFFTVYGPWGRPDMAIFRIISSALLNEDFIFTANDKLQRDFTYVDDVSNVIFGLLDENLNFNKPEIFNVAGGAPHTFAQMFKILESLGVSPKIKQSEQDSLDVNLTHGDTKKLALNNIKVPTTSLAEGLANTLKWMKTIPKKDLKNWYEYSK